MKKIIMLFFLLCLSTTMFANMDSTKNDENLTKITLWEKINDLNIKFPEIVFAQALLESGNFTSKVCKLNNNIFGMKLPKRRENNAIGKSKSGYAIYTSWVCCLEDYLIYQSYILSKKIYTRDSYLRYLDKIYCEIPGYKKQLLGIIKRNANIFNSIDVDSNVAMK